MDTKELARICEAILFAAGEPVETERLSFAAETDPDEVRKKFIAMGFDRVATPDDDLREEADALKADILARRVAKGE